MIKNFLLATAALAALAGTAAAADLPARRAPPVYVPPPIPVFTWTGFYAGAQLGYEFGKSNTVATSSAAGVLASRSTNPDGIIGGVHIGYLFSTQSLGFGGNLLGGGLVAGIEGDVNGSDYRSSYTLGRINDFNRNYIDGSVRGRLGVAVDRALFYATGGVAFGDLRNNYRNSLSGGVDALSSTRVGYTVGGGVEYAFLNNWSVRAEYRYTDYGSFNDTLVSSARGTVNVHHREYDHRVQAGLSYHFNTFAVPVVARY